MTGTSLDTRLQLVADRRRRWIIQQLRHEADGVTSIDEIVDRLRDLESATGDGRPEDEERLAIHLHHNHLPRLADSGMVEFDPERGTVWYESDERLEAVLDSFSDQVPVADL